MKITKIILLTIIFSIFTLQATALTFNNFTFGGSGNISTGNGYFNDEGTAFGYIGNRNVYAVAERTVITLVEPVSWASGTSPTNFQVINSSYGTIKSAIVVNGYLYFVDGSTLKKKKSRNDASLCESNDTAVPNGCILVIATGVQEPLATYNNVLYFLSTTTTLSHLDTEDNAVNDFTVPAGYLKTHALAVTKISGVVTAYVDKLEGANQYTMSKCNSVGCVAVHTSPLVATSAWEISYYVTSTYVYEYAKTQNQIFESLYYISNNTAVSVDYISSDVLQSRRIYVSGLSTIGLIANSNSYSTFNSNEAGVSSTVLSQGTGIVEYVNKEISVPNPTYYNDSTIPINVNLKFIISDTNHTNYLTSATWHLIAINPTGVQVEDHDLPIVCTQSQPWWDPFGVLSLFLIDLVTPWACDGTQTVQYSPNPGQSWMNGTWTIELTEQIPGTTSVLSTDTYNIVNQSSTGSGIVNPPVSCPTCGLGTGGTINTNTSLQIISVFSMIAFWGFIIWLGIVGTVIKTMASSPSGVNGTAVIVVAWLSAVFIALIGLFDPFKIYIIVLSTIIAAVLFRLGKNATTTED